MTSRWTATTEGQNADGISQVVLTVLRLPGPGDPDPIPREQFLVSETDSIAGSPKS
jgi:hypothetical protein